MYLRVVAFFVLCCFTYGTLASTRAYLRKCGTHGFTCTRKNGTFQVVYECPRRDQDYYIYLNEFNAPAVTSYLIIRNCKSLTLLLKCTKSTRGNKMMKYLKVSNIETLKIKQTANYQSQLPSEVVFENIGFISSIPSYAFTQPNQRLNGARCILPKTGLQEIRFFNVSVDTVHPNAFLLPSQLNSITFADSKINTLKTSAIVISNARDFSMHRSNVNKINPSALDIAAKKISFQTNKFAYISSSGIQTASTLFLFENNSVNTLQFHALSILSANVTISQNSFSHLKMGAFEKVSPPLLVNKDGSNVSYSFIENRINLAESGSLQPSLLQYGKIGQGITISRNTFSCECDKIDWLLSRTSSIASNPLEDFYARIFDEENENTCVSSCALPLNKTKVMVTDGACIDNITVEWLCDNRDKVATTPVSTVSDGLTTAAVARPATEPEATTMEIKSTAKGSAFSSTIFPLEILDSSRSDQSTAKYNLSSRKPSSISLEFTTANVEVTSLKFPKYSTSSSKTSSISHMQSNAANVASTSLPRKYSTSQTVTTDNLTSKTPMQRIMNYTASGLHATEKINVQNSCSSYFVSISLVIFVVLSNVINI